MNVCTLCKENEESHDHLFFKCNFSQNIWRKLKPLMQFKSNNENWNDIIEELAGKPNNNSIWSIIRRLCLAGAVYAIWKERNSRIFRDEQCSWEITLKLICETVRLGLMGLNVKNSMAVQQAATKWNAELLLFDWWAGIWHGYPYGLPVLAGGHPSDASAVDSYGE
ncbi:reverse transcriptase zinc-binding domain-containing protein [Tanacetum coccineum]